MFRKKKDVVHIPIATFDKNKHMTIVCIVELCSQSFTIMNDYYDHIQNEHNQIPNHTLPIYQDPNIQTYTELSCHLCRSEFTKQSNLT